MVLRLRHRARPIRRSVCATLPTRLRPAATLRSASEPKPTLDSTPELFSHHDRPPRCPSRHQPPTIIPCNPPQPYRATPRRGLRTPSRRRRAVPSSRSAAATPRLPPLPSSLPLPVHAPTRPSLQLAVSLSAPRGMRMRKARLESARRFLFRWARDGAMWLWEGGEGGVPEVEMGEHGRRRI